MTENKRYNITPSKIIENGFCIQDDRRKHSFPTTKDKSNLVMYEKALNEQDNEIQRLKKELKNRKKMNNILEGFLLDKGYDFNDILKFLQDRTENGEGE